MNRKMTRRVKEEGIMERKSRSRCVLMRQVRRECGESVIKRDMM